MNMLQTLSMRTTAALMRLGDLQRRADTAARGTASVLRPALRELSAALEELQVANDQLQTQVEELSELRRQMRGDRQLLSDLQEAMPVPCFWTDQAGNILGTNARAAALFNVSGDRLLGKPVLLFITDRETLFDGLSGLRTTAITDLELTLTIRPRERHPRLATVTIRR